MGSPPVIKPVHRPPVEREPPAVPKRPKPNPPPHNTYMQDDDIQEVVPVKTEPRDPHPQPIPSYSSPSVPDPSPSHAPPPPSQTHAVAPMEDSLAQYEEQYEDYGQYEDQRYEQLQEFIRRNIGQGNICLICGKSCNKLHAVQ